MRISDTALPEIKLLQPARHKDDRGWFMESWNRKALAAHGITADFVQDNVALSNAKGTVRGLHFQLPPHAQGKLVRAAQGAIFDVAVDVRRGSPRYGRHASATLTAEGGEMLWVPAGFAHGYCTLTDRAEVAYKVTDYYAPSAERGIRWNDAVLAISWPVTERDAVVGERDAALPAFQNLAETFVYGASS
ncbi:MAG TPA: dTDP-4-dehydrorhamnose 3,5-epimerase [Candidatus Cybelea sp.]|nr:dTDP-4-dehydrorhamnose 3,5-epimerase [Candidatus Cybelea sp.]